MVPCKPKHCVPYFPNNLVFFFLLKFSANRADPDEMPLYVVFHLGLSRLPKNLFKELSGHKNLFNELSGYTYIHIVKLQG